MDKPGEATASTDVQEQEDDSSIIVENDIRFVGGDEVNDDDDEELLKKYGLLDEPNAETETGPKDEPDGSSERQPEKPSRQTDPAADTSSTDAKPETQPTTTADDPASRTEPETDAPQPDAPEPPGPAQPFSFTVDKRKIDIPGAVVFEGTLPDGTRGRLIAMPERDFNRHVVPNVADRQILRQALTRAVTAEAQIENHEKVVKADAVLEFLDKLLDLEDDAVLTQLDEFRAGRSKWEQQQALAARDKQIEAIRKGTAGADPEPQELLNQMDEEELLRGMRTDVRTHAERLIASDPELKGYVDLGLVGPDLEDAVKEIYFIADGDIPLGNGQVLKNGEIGINFARLRQILGREASKAKALATRYGKRDSVADRNAAVLNAGTNGSRRPKQPEAAKAAALPGYDPPEPELTPAEAWKRKFMEE